MLEASSHWGCWVVNCISPIHTYNVGCTYPCCFVGLEEDVGGTWLVPYAWIVDPTYILGTNLANICLMYHYRAYIYETFFPRWTTLAGEMDILANIK